MGMFADYKCIVKGDKNACFALLYSMLDDTSVEEKKTTEDGDYYILFTGTVINGMNYGCVQRDNISQIDLPDNIEEVREVAQNYVNLPMKQKAKLFGVEIQYNCVVTEDWNGLEIGDYNHYLKNGDEIYDYCPSELEVYPYEIQERIDEADYLFKKTAKRLIKRKFESVKKFFSENFGDDDITEENAEESILELLNDEFDYCDLDVNVEDIIEEFEEQIDSMDE